jgi:hypothetical protein
VQLLHQLVSRGLVKLSLFMLTLVSGAAVIGDISTATERGHLMGILGAGKE